MGKLLALMFCLTASTAAAQSWTDPDLGRSILEGSATDNDIWLLGGYHKLVHFDRATGARQVIAEDVVDILEDGDHLWVASKAKSFGYDLTDVRAGHANKRTIFAEKLAGLVLEPDGVSALGSEALFLRAGEATWRSSELAGSVPALGSGAIAAADG